MYSFAERKLLDDVVHIVFSLQARGRLSEAEAGQLLVLNRMAEVGENTTLFNLLREVFIKPGSCADNEELKSLVLQTVLSSDLHQGEDIKLLEEMITEILNAASS